MISNKPMNDRDESLGSDNIDRDEEHQFLSQTFTHF
jgi:hypothetical protein